MSHPVPARTAARTAARAAFLGSVALPALLALALGTGLARAAAEIRPAKHALSNGLVVVVFEDSRLPVVSCRLVMRAGSAHEAPAQAGLAALTARALLLGSANSDAAILRRALESGGAEMSASASYDYSLATLRTHKKHWPRMLALFAETVSQPAFPEAEWEALKTRTASEVRLAMADAGRAADRHLGALLFGSTAYGRPVEGDHISVAALKPEDARRFHAERWLPNNAMLAVAGDVKAAEVLALLEPAFGAWKRGTIGPPVHVAHAAPPGNVVRILDAPDVPLVSVRIGADGPSRRDADQLAAAALHVLLADNRPGSRLRRALEERGLAEIDASSNWSFGAAAGSFEFSAEAPPGGVRAVVEACRDAAAALRAAPVSGQEMDLARRVLLGAAALGQETAGDRAERWLLASVYGQGEEYWSGYESRVRALAPRDLQRAARRFLTGDSLAVVAVGPRDVLRSQLADFGSVRVLPLGARTGAVPAVAIPLPASATPDTPESRARGRAVADSALAAHGGAAALERASSWRASGTLALGLAERETSGPFGEIFAWPDRWRTEMLIGGSRIVRTLDGETGWTASEGSVNDLDPTAASALQLTTYGQPVVLLRQLAAAPARVLYVGRETRDGRAVEVVDWLRADGGYTRVYFDASTRLLAASEQMERAQAGGAPIRVLRLFEDARPVQGLVLPFVTVLYAGEVRVSRQALESVEIGVAVSDETFRPPAR